MIAGRADQLCRFERRNETPDAYGNVSTGWATLLEIRGFLRFETGRERLAGGRPQSEVAAEIEVTALASTRAITAADRVVIDGETYAIRAVVEPPRRGVVHISAVRGAAG